MITNYEQSPNQVAIELKADKFGFGSDVKLEAADAITGEAVPTTNNTLLLDLKPEIYRPFE